MGGIGSATESRKIEPVRRLKLSDAVAAQLERMITGGSFAVGDKLAPERVLAEQFGVGRSSMREALRSVESIGLLRIEHGVGVFVASASKRAPVLDSESLVVGGYTIPELFEVRLAFEREAGGLAAKRITAQEGAELEALLVRGERAGMTDEEFIEVDAALHMAIVRATKNALLLRVFQTIQPVFVAYSRRVIELEGRRETAREGHRRIVEAIVGRRAAQARSAVVRHLRDVERDLVRQLAHGEPGSGDR